MLAFAANGRGRVLPAQVTAARHVSGRLRVGSEPAVRSAFCRPALTRPGVIFRSVRRTGTPFRSRRVFWKPHDARAIRRGAAELTTALVALPVRSTPAHHDGHRGDYELAAMKAKLQEVFSGTTSPVFRLPRRAELRRDRHERA